MLFDIGWPELLLIGIVALVVIGPKDLPRAMRIAGYWVRKARSMSREFQSSIDQMIREAELEEMRQEIEKVTEINIESELKKAVDPTGELAEAVKPPELPDYFDHSGTLAAAASEPAESEPSPALPAPTEAALPEQAVSNESEPEPIAPAPDAPEEATGTPSAVRDPAPPKP